MRVKSYSYQRPQVPWKHIVPIQESILIHLCTSLPSRGCKAVLKGGDDFNLATGDQCHILQIVGYWAGGLTSRRWSWIFVLMGKAEFLILGFVGP